MIDPEAGNPMREDPFSILDITLRDGSYLVDFQFTVEDTGLIASYLQYAGFDLIEIGHGLGLGASREGYGRSGGSDEEYLKIAAEVITRAEWGTFFIPGIGNADDLIRARDHGMDFVRVGTNINEADKVEPFIKLAKKLGLKTSYNAMKSYAVKADEFGLIAQKVGDWGADVIYLVDSSGSMLPEDVRQYIAAALEKAHILVGFHGHDNLSLAIANTLAALEAGAAVVDSSLQGMGRSAGNAATEILVALLKRKGHCRKVKLNELLDIGQGFIRPLLRQSGVDPMAVISGFAGFHSAYLKKIIEFSKKYDVDPRDMIIRLCQRDKINAPDELLEEIGRDLAGRRISHVSPAPSMVWSRRKSSFGLRAVEDLLDELQSRALKASKTSVVNVVSAERSAGEGFVVSGNIQRALSYVVGSVSLSSQDDLVEIMRVAEGKVDIVFYDVESIPFCRDWEAASGVTGSKTLVLPYLNSRVLVSAIENQVEQLLQPEVQHNALRLCVCGLSSKTIRLARNLVRRGFEVAVVNDENRMEKPQPAVGSEVALVEADSPEGAERLRTADMIILWPGDKSWFTVCLINKVRKESIVLLAGPEVIEVEAAEALRARGAKLIRIDIWPQLIGALYSAHQYAIKASKAMGWAVLEGHGVVAAGAVGRPGDLVLDSLSEPTDVIGVSDGAGRVVFQFDPPTARKVSEVTAALRQRLVSPNSIKLVTNK